MDAAGGQGILGPATDKLAGQLIDQLVPTNPIVAFVPQVVPGVAGVLSGLNFLNKELEPTHIIAKVLSQQKAQHKYPLSQPLRKPMSPPFAKDIGIGLPSASLSPVVLQKDGAPPTPMSMRPMSPKELEKSEKLPSSCL